jgi:hypothetical protein
MEWRRDGKAAPGERAAASAPGRVCPAPLVRLEPESPSTCLHAAGGTPAPGDVPIATCLCCATHRGCDPVARTTRAVSSRLSRAAGSQCPPFHRWASHDQGVRRPSSRCRLARVGNGITPRLPASDSLFSDHFAAPSGTSWSFFWLFLLLCFFCFPSCCCFHLSRNPCPILDGFRSRNRD